LLFLAAKIELFPFVEAVRNDKAALASFPRVAVVR
jgi:hypothetical protein